MYTYDDLRTEYRLASSGDKWGDAMQTWFGIAAELYWRDPFLVPTHWNYRPPATTGDPRESEDYLHEILAGASNESLIRFGDVLQRYCRACEHAGLSY